jgi:glycosyltransferase involved in cell wall biosynthesis
MSRRIRVLSLYEGFFAGGARIVHTDIIAGLHESGGQEHSVLSLASRARRESTVQRMHEDPRYRRLTRAGVPVRTLGRLAESAPPERATFSERELRIARRAVERADVVLTLKEQPLGLLLALRDRGLMPDVPVATCLHRSDPAHSGPALGWLREAAATGLITATISCAESTADEYARVANLTGPRYVIANGIDTDRFRPGTGPEVAAARERHGIPLDAAVVVFAARFDAMKNPGLFLRSVATHSRERPGTHYIVCGAGMSATNPAFAALLAESGVDASTRLHALGIRDDMPSIYQIADVVALTSAFGEASPLCLLEGAACGATPVTTNVGDSARQVDGIGIVTPHDADGISAAWESVLEDREEFRARALASRPRLGRGRMITEYREAVHSLLRVESAAA